MSERPHIYVKNQNGIPRADWTHPRLPDPNVSARNAGFTCEIRCYWPFGADRVDVLERLRETYEEAMLEVIHHDHFPLDTGR